MVYTMVYDETYRKKIIHIRLNGEEFENLQRILEKYGIGRIGENDCISDKIRDLITALSLTKPKEETDKPIKKPSIDYTPKLPTEPEPIEDEQPEEKGPSEWKCPNTGRLGDYFRCERYLKKHPENCKGCKAIPKWDREQLFGTEEEDLEEEEETQKEDKEVSEEAKPQKPINTVKTEKPQVAKVKQKHPPSGSETPKHEWDGKAKCGRGIQTTQWNIACKNCKDRHRLDYAKCKAPQKYLHTSTPKPQM